MWIVEIGLSVHAALIMRPGSILIHNFCDFFCVCALCSMTSVADLGEEGLYYHSNEGMVNPNVGVVSFLKHSFSWMIMLLEHYNYFEVHH